MLITTDIISAQTIYVSGNISVNTTWSADTVKITDNVIIDSSITLTINPGVYVEAQGFYTVDVKGSILAVGTETDSITFTVNDTTNFYITDTLLGGWHGIHFNSTNSINDSSKFVYCNFYFGKATYNPPSAPYDFDGGALYIFGYSKIDIRNCCFKNNFSVNNGGAIYCDNEEIVIINTSFINNTGLAHGGGICTNGCFKVTISENLFTGNMTGG